MNELVQKTAQEVQGLDALREACRAFVESDRDHWDRHLALFMTRPALSRVLWWNKIYESLVDVPGVILEFGCQWGSTLSVLTSLRGIHEPYNHARRIVGFDTFEGFKSIGDQDGSESGAGDYATSASWDESLRSILALHEAASPLAHIRKFEIVSGDVTKTFPEWLEQNPGTVVAMAIFDMDLYEPTKETLQRLLATENARQAMPKGSILVFDQLGSAQFPGETRALDDVLGLRNIRLRGDPHQPGSAWAII